MSFAIQNLVKEARWLKPAARMVLDAYAHYCFNNRGEDVCKKISAIAEFTGMTERTVQRWVRYLEVERLLVVADDGRGRATGRPGQATRYNIAMSRLTGGARVSNCHPSPTETGDSLTGDGCQSVRGTGVKLSPVLLDIEEPIETLSLSHGDEGSPDVVEDPSRAQRSFLLAIPGAAGPKHPIEQADEFTRWRVAYSPPKNSRPKEDREAWLAMKDRPSLDVMIEIARLYDGWLDAKNAGREQRYRTGKETAVGFLTGLIWQNFQAEAQANIDGVPAAGADKRAAVLALWREAATPIIDAIGMDDFVEYFGCAKPLQTEDGPAIVYDSDFLATRMEERFAPILEGVFECPVMIVSPIRTKRRGAA